MRENESDKGRQPLPRHIQVELGRYRTLGESLTALVVSQLDDNIAKAVSDELDARDTDDVADAERERARSAEIADAVNAAVTEAMRGRVTDWLSPTDIVAALNEKAYSEIATALIDNEYITADVYHDVTVDLRANK